MIIVMKSCPKMALTMFKSWKLSENFDLASFYLR